MKALLQRGRTASGQAVAEFVIVLPLVLLLFMAIVGFGYLMYSQMIVMESANRGARLGAVLYGDSSVSTSDAYSQTRTAALALLDSGLGSGTKTVNISLQGNDIHVTVRFQTNVFLPLLKEWLGDQLTVEHESIYRIERDSL